MDGPAVVGLALAILGCAPCPSDAIELAGECIETTSLDRAIDAGWDHWCSEGTDDTISCGGESANGQGGEHVGWSVAAGARHSCALTDGGRVTCWGEAVEVPTETGWVDLDVGDGWGCGVHGDGSVVCWGGEQPDEVVETVDVGAAHACGVTRDGAVHCWGDVPSPAPEGAFVQASAGGTFSCGVEDGGQLVCWGEGAAVDAAPDRDDVRAVSAGLGHACALTDDAQAICWGEDGAGQASPPVTSWQSVRAGGRLSCGLTVSGHSVCWGAATKE